MIDEQSFLKKREQLSLNIRKENRQQIFMKRRNFNSFLSEQQLQISENQNPVIDPARQQNFKEIDQMNLTIQMLPQFFSAIYSDNIDQLHYGMRGIRKILCRIKMMENKLMSEIPHQFLQHLPMFAKCMQEEKYPQLRLETSWIIATLASQGGGWCESIVASGCAEMLVKLVRKCDKYTLHHTIFAIGNLSADEISCRDYLLKHQTLTALLERLNKEESTSFLRLGAWAISNLSRGNPNPPYELVKPALPFFCSLIKQQLIKDKQIQSGMLWSMSNMTEKGFKKLKPIIQFDIILELFQYSVSSFDEISFPALRILGNFSLGNTQMTAILLNNNILDVSIELLNRGGKKIRRQVAWILSNIASGIESEVNQFLVRVDVINKLLLAFLNDLPGVKKQIAWIFANFTRHGPPQKLLQFYLSYDILKYFQKWLQEEGESNNLQNFLECFEKILSFGEKKAPTKNLISQSFNRTTIPNKLFELQHHSNEIISNFAVKILNKYSDKEYF